MQSIINNSTKNFEENKIKYQNNNFIISEYNNCSNIYDKYLYCISKLRDSQKCKNIINQLK